MFTPIVTKTLSNKLWFTNCIDFWQFIRSRHESCSLDQLHTNIFCQAIAAILNKIPGFYITIFFLKIILCNKIMLNPHPFFWHIFCVTFIFEQL